jgi:hypothetical protein
MLGTSVDPEVSVAQAMAVLVWGDLDREAQVFALDAMCGRVSNTVGRKPVAVDRGRLHQKL